MHKVAGSTPALAILGVYSLLSIAAMPPVSLVDRSWAMDPSDR